MLVLLRRMKGGDLTVHGFRSSFLPDAAFPSEACEWLRGTPTSATMTCPVMGVSAPSHARVQKPPPGP
jgi:hypothetical protein